MRDRLALERTRLANERTFLAYVRTSLSLFAAGAVLLQFFSTHESYLLIAWFLLACGGIVIVFGAVRFFRVRSMLNRAIVNTGR
jgi:putative membrane protein